MKGNSFLYACNEQEFVPSCQLRRIRQSQSSASSRTTPGMSNSSPHLLPLLLVPLPKSTMLKDSHWLCQRPLTSSQKRIKKHTCGTAQYCGWCAALSENKGNIITYCVAKAQRGSSITFPWDRGGCPLLTQHPWLGLGKPRTGNLQSFLLHLGPCYHLLSFKMNIRGKSGHLLFLPP